MLPSASTALLSVCATLLATLLATASPAAAQEKSFSHKGVAADADRYESYVRREWQGAPAAAPGTTKKSNADLRLIGEKSLTSDPRAASRSFAAAVAAEPEDARAWLGLAKSLLAIKPDTTKGSERYDLPVNASAAAYRAFQRASTKPTKAAALAVLGEALTRRSYWRPAIEAYALSLANADEQSVREALDKLRAQHGFRMVDYKVDSDTGTARLCVQFSEGLSRAQGVDLSKFIAVDGKDPKSLSAEGKQLCLEGLTFGQRYEVQVRAGLPSDVGETIAKPIDIGIYVPDRSPQAKFAGRGYVLPSRGQQGIPVVTVNASAVDIKVYRIGDRALATSLRDGEILRQLSSYELEDIKSRNGQQVYSGVLEVAAKPNEDVTTAFPVSDAIGTLKPGVYILTAKPTDKSNATDGALATQWFVVSDLALTALTAPDGIHGFVRSLETSNPVGGAEVRLLARNNEVLASAKSDARGYVRFDGGLAKGEGGLQPMLLVAEKDGADYAFLDLASAGFDLSDRGVKGRDPAGALDAFVFTERGVYRPGEEVHLTAIVRDKSGQAQALPTTLVLTRPDGVEHRRMTVADGGLGGRSASIALNRGVMTGTWRAKLFADPKADPIGQVAFLVEDFVPERIDLKLEPASPSIAVEETATIKATGRYLYGPPASGLALEGDIVVRAVKDLDGYPGYRFGLADEKIEPVRQPIEGLPSTGADGLATLSVGLPPIPKTFRPLEAELIVRLKETGGRSVERTLKLPVDARQPRIGIKPLFGTTGVGEAEAAGFDVVALGPDGKRLSGKWLSWTLTRLDTNWQWYSRDGNWAYDSVTTSRKVAEGKVDTSADQATRLTVTPDFGRYRLEVSNAADGTVSSVAFSAGWVTNGETVESPEALETALDKASYRPGETAKLRIASKHAGKALVTVLSNGLLAAQEVDVPKGGVDVTIPVSAEWGPGAYATALFYRAMDPAAKRMPGRSIGVRWLAIDRSAETLKVAMAPEAKVRSAAMLKVPVKVSGLQAGEEARITVAAVDAGVLNLTRFQSPNPEGHFYAQRKLGLEIRDFYGRLIDGMRADRGKLRSGGDGVANGALAGAPPTVEVILAQYSGIVRVGADGSAAVEFQLPQFNGTVRLMAVAWSKDKVGHGTTEVIVRDPVAVTASAPRFLTLGDEARLDIAVHNVEGAPGTYQVAVTSGAASIAGRDIALAAGERKSEALKLKPADVGTQVYDVTVSGPALADGTPIKVQRQLTFKVLPPAGDIKRTTVSQLAPGGKLTLSADLAADLIASRTSIDLSVGPQAGLDVPGLLTALDRYPYGCAEQTVSRAMPLVYANGIATRFGLKADAKIRERVQGAIERVSDMQDSSGAFGVWGPSSPDMWLTAYVTDFLTRAKENGYTINPRSHSQALDRLQNFVSYAKDLDRGGEDRAYALYVLARNGRAPIGELRYYADAKLDRFGSPLAKAQLGAALAMMGDKPRAEATFAAALAGLETKPSAVLRSDFGSELRDQAAVITLASEAGVAKAESPKLVNLLAKAYAARIYTSTQEQAWMVLAANAVADEAKSVKLSVNGVAQSGPLTRQLTPAELAAGPVTITNDGDAATGVMMTITGAALTPEPPASKGFKLERSFYTLDGKKLDLKSADGGISELKQNDRLVVVVSVNGQERAGRVLLVDRLPAGLEIENPRIVDAGDTKSLAWLKTLTGGSVRPEHTEFRDDRFVAAFNFLPRTLRNTETEAEPEAEGEAEGDGEAAAQVKKPADGIPSVTVAYIVRAVTPGSFVHPAATVEDMYRPERHARTGSGRLTVK
jgi:uncharacterized protein YfaS (alpha-2-macroglobulin family)